MTSSLPAQDCDGNGIPDACDLSCGAPGGACDVPGCGESPDCNHNAVPDTCDLLFPRPAYGVDACTDAAPVGPGRQYTGTTLGVTNDGSASCAASMSSPDVWYRYQPAESGDLTVSLCGSSYDTALSIHSGCPGTMEKQLACNDDSIDCGLDSIITLSVTAGETYWIRIAGFSGATGSYAMMLTGPACMDCQSDCNENQVPDACDISSGTSADCNLNGSPDECEPQEDCNSNGTLDICDLYTGTSQDCNHSQVPDECESQEDCNDNGELDLCEDGTQIAFTSGQMAPFGGEVPQTFEVLYPPRAGSNVTMRIEARADLEVNYPPCQAEYMYAYLGNGFLLGTFFSTSGHFCPSQPDVIQFTIPADTLNSAILNERLQVYLYAAGNVGAFECSAGSYVAVSISYRAVGDCNGNFVLDECELESGAQADVNQNGIPDVCDPDCNENLTPDDYDIAQGSSEDCDNSAIPDECEPDHDQDGRISACDNCPSIPNPDQADVDEDGVGDVCDDCPATPDPAQCDLDENGVGDACQGGPPVESALLFNGYSSHARIPDCPAYHFGDGDFTVEAWFTAAGNGFILDKRIDSGSGEHGFFLQVIEDGSLSFGIEIPQQLHNETAVLSPAGVSYADGLWHHVAGVREGNNIFIYVDGELRGTNTLTLLPMNITHPGPVVVGARHSVEQAVPGIVDEVRLWSVPRTQQQIAATRTVGLPADEPGLIGYWKLYGGCSQQQMVDSSLSGNNGHRGLTGEADSYDAVWVLSSAPVFPPEDSDGDGLYDHEDNCLEVQNPDQANRDEDRWGDACDNCPDVTNADQANLDEDSLGDVCDPDDDDDGQGDVDDNCPREINPNQEDADGDDVGDACDACADTMAGLVVDGLGCPLPVPADFDGDFDVDLSDFGHLQVCLSGSGVAQTDPACADVRLDEDGDVDHNDFGLLMRCFSGPNHPGNAHCLD